MGHNVKHANKTLGPGIRREGRYVAAGPRP
jgi:hypothetical protein